MRKVACMASIGCLLLAVAAPAQARIKLTTLPERESVRIDIQNGRYTLVEEERTVNLQAGRNQVDFSWANINIDKDSIVFRVIKADGEVNVLEHQLSAQRERPVLDRQRREGRAGRGADLLPHRQHGRGTQLPGRGRERRKEAAHAGLHDGHEHLGREFRRDDRAAGRGQDHGAVLQRRRAEADAGRQVRRRAHRQALRLRRRGGPAGGPGCTIA